MQKVYKNLFIISANILILMGIAFLWLYSIREKRIQKTEKVKIQIIRQQVDKTLLQDKEVKHWLSLFYKKDIRNIPTYALKPKLLEKFIGERSVVKKAEVYLDALQNLHIDVFQRNPIVRVIDVRGNQYYLDEEGYKIELSSQYSVRVPVATGVLAPVITAQLSAKDQLFYKSLLLVANQISQDSFSNALIEQIDMDGNGEFTLIPKIGTEKIFLGSIELLNDKLDRLKLFYKENMGRQGWNIYETINLKYKGQVIGKRNKAIQES